MSSDGGSPGRNYSNDDEEQQLEDCYLPQLYLDVLKGDLKAAKSLDQNRLKGLITLPMTDEEESVLHIAALANQEKFLEYLVKHIVDEVCQLEVRNKKGITVLCYVAITGNVKMAKMIYMKKHTLLQSTTTTTTTQRAGPCVDGTKTPLYFAARSGHRPMVDYLYQYGEPAVAVGTWTMDSKIAFLNICIHAGFYDVALRILDQQNVGSIRADMASNNEVTSFHNQQNLESSRNIRESMKILAQNPMPDDNDGLLNAGIMGSWCKGKLRKQRDNCRELIKKLLPLAYNDPKCHEATYLLFQAANSGNTLMVVELIRRNPDIVWKSDENHGSIFHLAVENRHEGIFNLLHELGSIADTIVNEHIDSEEERKNIIHLAAELSPLSKRNRFSGAALQMHRDALWFKEVKKMVYPSLMKMKNGQDKTPEEVFVEKHEGMRKAGEKWIKDTAKSSMIVATLIATVAFSAAFSVPGGFDQNSGKPILLSHSLFLVFSLADGIALFSSALSLLFFLSILTSRYAVNDFLIYLPLKLMIGSTSLFISIGAMAISFGATFILYNEFLEGTTVIYFLYFSFPFLPILYVCLNYFIFHDMIRSAFAFFSLFQPRQRQLFY